MIFVDVLRRPVMPLIVAVLSVLMVGCNKGGGPVVARQNPEAREARPVRVTRVADVALESTVVVTGTLAAYDQATISTKVAGRVREMKVDLGTVVNKGQTIAQIEPRDYQLRLQQAEAALSQARARLGLPPEGSDDRIDPEDTGTVKQANALLDDAKLKRERSLALFEQGVISRAQLDSVEAEYKVALSRHQDAFEEIRNRQALIVQRRSEVDLARQQLSDTTITAPFDGIIQERRVSAGEYLAGGAPVANLVRMDPLRLRAEVPEREARDVHKGQQVRVTVEGDANVYTGFVARLSPTITAQNRVLIVEAEVRNKGTLRPGSFAKAEIVADDLVRVPCVPARSIVTFAGIDKVISIEDGKALERPITTGRHSGEWVEIVAGVKVGDVIVTEPGSLQSGQPVTVVE